MNTLAEKLQCIIANTTKPSDANVAKEILALLVKGEDVDDICVNDDELYGDRVVFTRTDCESDGFWPEDWETPEFSHFTCVVDFIAQSGVDEDMQ